MRLRCLGGLGFRPHPRPGFPVQLPGGDPRCLVDFVSVGEVLPGQSLPPEQSPPGLDEVRPGRALRDERMRDPRMPFEPLSHQYAVVGLQVVGDQVGEPFRDGPLYPL
jgi:hypothetical protein